jgi:hypothetical protein
VIWSLLYGAGIAGVLVATASCKGYGDRRSGSVLGLNYVLVLTGHLLTGSTAPWLWFIAADGLCAWLVLHPPASRIQAAIGALYVLQIIIHVAFAAAGSAVETRLYLNLLAVGGWCQLLILATGTWHHGRRRKVAAVGGGVGAVTGAAQAHRESVAE